MNKRLVKKKHKRKERSRD